MQHDNQNQHSPSSFVMSTVAEKRGITMMHTFYRVWWIYVSTP